jgi:hypothetical protein
MEILQAFSQKTRNDFITARSQTDEAAYADNVKVAYDIAEVLQRNIVQGFVSRYCFVRLIFTHINISSLQENGIYSTQEF